MRLLIPLVFVAACLFTCEGRRQHKNFEKKDFSDFDKPTAALFHKGAKYGRRGRNWGKHVAFDKLKEKHQLNKPADAAWMRFPESKEKCKTVTCGRGEFCLVSPKTGAEKCINKKSFRDGRRLFRTFHKEKAKLKDQSQIKELEEKLLNAEHMKDVYDLMKDFKPNTKMGKYGRPSHHDRKRKQKKNHTDHKKASKADDKVIEIKSSQDQNRDRLLHHEQLVKEATSVQECRPHEFYELRKRLVNWFVMLHTESRQSMHHRGRKFDNLKKHPGHHEHKQDKHHHNKDAENPMASEKHGRCDCTKSVMWEFRKQDTDNDHHLSHTEIADMESNRREPCMKPYLKSCDFDGDARISHGEWCCCFSNTPAPCEEKKKLSDPKDFVPRCDKEGFYQREQCHSSGYCWCVDLNGNMINDTKVKGSAHCGKYDPNGHLIKM